MSLVKTASRGRSRRLPVALTALSNGQPIILFDDPGRENEADFVMPAATITPDQVKLLIQSGGGLICVPIAPTIAARLELVPMTPRADNQEFTRCALTQAVDTRVGIGTGISAADRATTIRRLADPLSVAHDLVRPGHVFPILAHHGGLQARRGHTEASLELMSRAGHPPVATICEILGSSGAVATKQEVLALARRHQIPWLTVNDLQPPYLFTDRYPLTCTAKTTIPTRFGTFQARLYTDWRENQDHLALISQTDPYNPKPLIRLHSRCLTGDALWSQRCDCGQQLTESLKQIGRAGGVLLYLDQEGRGTDLRSKLRAYALQDQGLDTVEAQRQLSLPVDARSYQTAAGILQDLKVTSAQLLTNNPAKLEALRCAGLAVTRRPLTAAPSQHSQQYLQTKRDHLGHLFEDLGRHGGSR